MALTREPETDRGQFEQTPALHVHLLVPVNENVGDGRVLQQRLERTQAENLVQDLLADLLALKRAQQRLLAVHERDDRLPHFRADALVVDCGQRLQVDLVQQFAVKRELQFLVFRPKRVLVPPRIAEQPLVPGQLLRRFHIEVARHHLAHS